jgi:dTDP-4-dehydrorhamnose 3,5-epimerase
LRKRRYAEAYLINLEPVEDARGFFARAFCRREFEEHRLNPAIAQCNMSFNQACGTLRGMHYQVEPAREVKIIRCIAGKIFDAIIDLRPESSSYCRWFGVELSARNRRALYVPEGLAHGYLTLSDDSEIHYMVSEFYSPGLERGIRWDDPAFGIEWPMSPRVISEKDASHPDFK